MLYYAILWYAMLWRIGGCVGSVNQSTTPFFLTRGAAILTRRRTRSRKDYLSLQDIYINCKREPSYRQYHDHGALLSGSIGSRLRLVAPN